MNGKTNDKNIDCIKPHGINVLEPEIANLIAAGEVVDRPASVIKELLENAIDSGATIITTEIQRGGVTYMRVTDNGCGITFDDLPKTILRHATSKIKTAEDLNSIWTLGFRGEALAAIAAVSHLRIISRPHTEEFGGLLDVVGGEIISHTETGCSTGTTVIVEDLFANVPARRKFLKKDVSEAAAIYAIFERIALSHPEISFRLISDGALKMRTEGNGDLRSAIYSILGREFTQRTIPVSYEYNGVGVTGYIGMPDTARANRNGQMFFINGRYVRTITAQVALEQAYRTFIPEDRFPACVLMINIPVGFVDINVHPAKLEVKFSNEKLIFEAIYYAVRPALEENMRFAELPLGSKTPSATDSYKRRAQAAAASFAPVRDGSQNRKPTQIEITPKQNITKAQETQQKHSVKSETPSQVTPDLLASIAAIVKTNQTQPLTSDETLTSSPDTSATKKSLSESQETIEGTGTLENETSPVTEYKILGEAWDCYVIVETSCSIYLIDKHAAHERILFERLRRNMRERAAEGASQLLMTPLKVQLTSEEAAVITEYSSDIRATGFDFTLDGNTAIITALPQGFTTEMATEAFVVFGSELQVSVGETRDAIFERTLFSCACKAAIKGGRVYGDAHIRWLCDELFSLPDIKYCPHGRPVTLEITKSSLDRQFGRIK
ncbi:MAG: DNA mismatch repair endonuclease MutL [Eubacteriales bacterium]|jgi:DNA mismatch repair protein MutL|nr:DNA mismatch repair endonuclease MutL [Clostridiales bacterium]